MSTYKVRQQEIWDTYTLIEAETEADAIKRVLDGEGDNVHSEFNRMVDGFAEIERDKDLAFMDSLAGF